MPHCSNGQADGCRSALRLRLIVVLTEKLLEVMGDDVTQEQAFAHANDVLKNAVGGISNIIHIPGLVNVDLEDVKTVMSEPGKATFKLSESPCLAMTAMNTIRRFAADDAHVIYGTAYDETLGDLAGRCRACWPKTSTRPTPSRPIA